jgi:hypothetical protein
MHERRRNRSGTPHEAVRLFLQAVAARYGLEALALTNEDGLLVAGTATAGGTGLDLDWIGAVGCVCAVRGRRGPSLGALVHRATGGRHLEATEIVVRGERLYLAGVGPSLLVDDGGSPGGGTHPLPAPEPPGWAGAEVAAGITRILSQSLPAVA